MDQHRMGPSEQSRNHDAHAFATPCRREHQHVGGTAIANVRAASELSPDTQIDSRSTTPRSQQAPADGDFAKTARQQASSVVQSRPSEISGFGPAGGTMQVGAVLEPSPS